MRLFYAVELPDVVREQLGSLRPHESTAYRWVEPELMHVTLVFMGEQPPERLPAIEAAGASAAGATVAANLRLAGIGRFGPTSAPRVLLATLGGDVEALARLQSTLARSLRDGGFTLEDRPFRPHITLARRRANAPPGGLLALPALPSALPSVAIPMDHLTLFQSRLSPRGPTYTPLSRYPLRV